MYVYLWLFVIERTRKSVATSLRVIASFYGNDYTAYEVLTPRHCIDNTPLGVAGGKVD